MNSYKDLTRYFGVSLPDTNFHSFIKTVFSDITDYNVTESEYMTSENHRIELGFTNNEAVFDEGDNVVFNQGNPIFSHINIYPKSSLMKLPFEVSFAYSRNQVLSTAGQPTQTKRGEASFLGSAFLVDNYKVGDLIVTFDYEPEKESINFIQIRDNSLVAHLKL